MGSMPCFLIFSSSSLNFSGVHAFFKAISGWLFHKTESSRFITTILTPLRFMDNIASSQIDCSVSNSVLIPPQCLIPPAKLKERCIKHAHILSSVELVEEFNFSDENLCDIKELGAKLTIPAADICLIKLRLLVILFNNF